MLRLPRYQIGMDVSHKQKFWNDPANMAGMDPQVVDRVKYMTGEFTKTAASVDAKLVYLKDEIKPGDLVKCNLLFIHIPSAKYTPAEVDAITKYIKAGGHYFL